MDNELDLVAIRTVQGDLSAQLIKSRLESEGIPSILQSQTYWDLILAIHSPVTVVVPRRYASEATRIVEEARIDLITTIPKRNLWLFTIWRLICRLFIGTS